MFNNKLILTSETKIYKYLSLKINRKPYLRVQLCTNK